MEIILFMLGRNCSSENSIEYAPGVSQVLCLHWKKIFDVLALHLSEPSMVHEWMNCAWTVS